MSLIPLNEIAQNSNPLHKGRWGIVINNDDPHQICRIQVEVEGIYKDPDNTGGLPWIAKFNGSFLGNSSNSEEFAVPEIKSKVWIIWPFGEKYMPFYTNYPYDQISKTDEFLEDYPNTYGIKDSSGFSIKRNKFKQNYRIEKKDAYKLELIDIGKINLNANSNVDINSPSVNINGILNVSTGKSASVSAGNVTLVFSNGILVDILK